MRDWCRICGELFERGAVVSIAEEKASHLECSIEKEEYLAAK